VAQGHGGASQSSVRCLLAPQEPQIRIAQASTNPRRSNPCGGFSFPSPPFQVPVPPITERPDNQSGIPIGSHRMPLGSTITPKWVYSHPRMRSFVVAHIVSVEYMAGKSAQVWYWLLPIDKAWRVSLPVSLCYGNGCLPWSGLLLLRWLCYVVLVALPLAPVDRLR
jgi:hypothetical protein